MSYTASALVLALSLSSIFAPFRTSPTHRMISTVTASIVRIEITHEDGKGVCTGFVVAVDRVQTAAHCLGDVMTADGEDATVVAIDPSLDLMLLKATTHKPALRFADKAPEVYSQVVGIGYAQGFTRVIALFAMVELHDYAPGEGIAPGLIVVGPWIHGMSGGPVVNLRGEVVGIVQRANDGLGYGVSAQVVRDFMRGAS